MSKPQKLPARVEAPFAAACAWDEMLTAFDRIRQACEGGTACPAARKRRGTACA